MRVGVMIGPERGDSARKVARMLDDVAWAEGAGLDTAWVPQIPGDFDALTAVALMGTRTTRIELGTAVVPVQAQHPVALARQALSAQAAAGGRLTLGLGPSHHWIIYGHARAALPAPGRLHPRLPRGPARRVQRPRSKGSGRRGERDVHRAQPARPGPGRPAAGPGGRARPGDAGAGGRAGRRDRAVDGRRTGHRRARGAAHHQGGRGRGPPGAAGRRGHPGLPVPALGGGGGAGARQPDPRRGRDLPELPADAGARRRQERRRPVRGGRRAAIAARFRRFADAGVTDLSVRLLPIGQGRDELVASKLRTRDMLAELAKDQR